MKRLCMRLTGLALALLFAINCSGYALATSADMPRASPTLNSYSAILKAGTTSGTVRISYDVIANKTASSVGISSIVIPPLSIAGGPRRFVGIHFVETRIDALLFRALEICLPPVLSVRGLNLIFVARLLPPAKGEGGKADVNIAVFYRGNLLLILLVDMGKVLRLICRYPFSLVLL